MKRPTPFNGWPDMTAHTLQQISAELIRARKKHPEKGQHLNLMISYTNELRSELLRHRAGGGYAAQVQALCYTVAAMAIRIAEEGDADFPYQGTARLPL